MADVLMAPMDVDAGTTITAADRAVLLAVEAADSEGLKEVRAGPSSPVGSTHTMVVGSQLTETFSHSTLIRQALLVGGRPSVADVDGNTALYACTGGGLLSCMEILLNNGAEPNQPNGGGFTAM
jgi:hypothetical protein